MTRYKAEKAGGTVVLVDPRLTSQTCSGCGTIVRKELSVRVHECSECGLVLNRDHNAAKNILQRAVLGPWFHKLGSALTGTGNLGNELVSVASKS